VQALELTRYVHLNPVRATLAERPEKYAWSSYREYLGLREAAAWLDCQTVVRELGRPVGRTDRRTRGFAPSSRFAANQVTGQDLTPFLLVARHVSHPHLARELRFLWRPSLVYCGQLGGRHTCP
jgi:hypothetical protein